MVKLQSLNLVLWT